MVELLRDERAVGFHEGSVRESLDTGRVGGGGREAGSVPSQIGILLEEVVVLFYEQEVPVLVDDWLAGTSEA